MNKCHRPDHVRRHHCPRGLYSLLALTAGCAHGSAGSPSSAGSPMSLYDLAMQSKACKPTSLSNYFDLMRVTLDSCMADGPVYVPGIGTVTGVNVDEVYAELVHGAGYFTKYIARLKFAVKYEKLSGPMSSHASARGWRAGDDVPLIYDVGYREGAATFRQAPNGLVGTIKIMNRTTGEWN